MADVTPFDVRSLGAEYVIIAMFGGDNNLSRFVYEDLQEMGAGSRGRVAVLALADFERQPASVVEVGADGEIGTIEEWGEIDTGDPETLGRFVSRALVTHADARKAIGFWDHGTGVFDETDLSETLLTRRATSVVRSDRSRSHPARRLFFPKVNTQYDVETRSMLHDDTNGGVLTNLEAGRMLGASFERAGHAGRKVDLIYSDTCLNGMLEVLDELGAYGECIVASSDLEPGDGWDYERWLSQTSDSPPASADDWARQAVTAFHESYVTRPDQHPCTLGAFRTGHNMTEAFKHLVATAEVEGLQGFYALDVARARSQSFNNRDTYDLVDFSRQVIEAAQTEPLESAAESLEQACLDARVHWTSLGDKVQNSHGLAFWFPGSRYTLRNDIKTYRRLAFAQSTGWADYLEDWR